MATQKLVIKTSRCEPYPLIEPQGYVVGFTLYATENGHSMYKDVFVSFGDLLKADTDTSGSFDNKERNLVLDLAYKKIESGVNQWMETVGRAPAILGEVYTPPPPAPAKAMDDDVVVVE